MLRVSKVDYGTDDGRFQGGDPLTGSPATRVTAAWLNSIQEEVTTVIEKRGITLDGNDSGQLLKAILDIYNYGFNPVSCQISNGVKTETDLPLEPFDKARLKAIYFNALSVRHTTKADETFFTSHVAVFNSYTSSWTLLTQYDPAILSLTFPKSSAPATQPDPVPTVTILPGPHYLSISASGKLQYQTSLLDGDSHQGTLTLSHFRYLRVGGT